jgi:hypothetical protein
VRLDPKLVHPSIFEATDGVMFNTNLASKDAKALAEFQKEWFKEYGLWLLGWVAALVFAFVGAISFTAGQPKGVRVATILGILITMVSSLIAGLMVNRRRMSLKELETLLPILDLTETQRAYAQTVVALGNMGQSRGEIDETMRALNALLDEETRLLATRTRLSGSESQDERAHLVSERERLAGKTSSAQDPSARAAFEQSLGLLDERLKSFEMQGTHLERIDAHLELLRQAVLATRDAARRLNGGAVVTAPDLATDSLRSAVALARAQTQATEAALAELRAI